MFACLAIVAGRRASFAYSREKERLRGFTEAEIEFLNALEEINQMVCESLCKRQLDARKAYYLDSNDPLR